MTKSLIAVSAASCGTCLNPKNRYSLFKADASSADRDPNVGRRQDRKNTTVAPFQPLHPQRITP
jgi:hypothetical protein